VFGGSNELLKVDGKVCLRINSGGIKENGVVYHYYCAVNKQERFIALATSKPMKK